jgi:putative lipoic acid-binding regulatory protein
MNTPAPPDPNQASPLTFPCAFPIKVMGLKVDGFVQAMTVIARGFDPGFDPSTIELRDSRGGKYLGITLTVEATSREQLDELYRTLTSHPMVKVVL